jgi:hypothetical protein
MLSSSSFRATFAKAAQQATLARGLLFLLFIATIVLAIYLLGQRLAISVTLGLYVILWGRYPWWVGTIFALIIYAVVDVLYGRVLHINFQPPALF